MDDKKRLKAEAKAEKKLAKAKSQAIKPPSSDAAERSADAAERNARIRFWQLVVAALAAIAVISSVLWQIFG